MTFGRLLLRNLLFHWRGNLAVLLGVALGTAVLTGALLVGDSLRGSLREVAFRQLGQVDQVLVANRLFNQSAARGLDKTCKNVAPLLVLLGHMRDEAFIRSQMEVRYLTVAHAEDVLPTIMAAAVAPLETEVAKLSDKF